ncbi:MAG: T9SS type A sorting domain-containing protein [Bacteroidota bacterium]
MKTTIYTLSGIFFGIFSSGKTFGQCTTAGYGQYPPVAYSMSSCNGNLEVISPSCYAGEYSEINVSNGYYYFYESSVFGDYLTITDGNGVPINYGFGDVTFTSTYNGVARLYTHTNASCGESSSPRERRVSCVAAAPCLNSATYGQFPLDTYEVPVCDGSTINTIASICYAGEYSMVHLEPHKTYTFSSSNPTDYLTISDYVGVDGYISGPSPIIFNSYTNQTVRFYTHTSPLCGESNVSRSRNIVCKPANIGCTDGTFYPMSAYTPLTCDNVTENVINTDARGGQYTLVNAENNKAYTFKSSNGLDVITVTDFSGNNILAYGATPLDFQPMTNGQYRFYIHADMFCSESTSLRTRSVICNSNLGLADSDFGSWNVYPNPATENVTVTASAKLDEISIMTIDGKLLQTIVPTEVSTTINIERLSSGTYFIVGIAQGVRSVKELVIE